MPELKELLVEQLQDLLHVETQLTGALPKMAEAAHNPKLREAFEKHLGQTEMHVERLKQALSSMNERSEPKPCQAIVGLIEDARKVIQEGANRSPVAADLACIGAAQKAEHLEIAAYGTARTLARQLGLVNVATLLSHTLGEEEGADHILTMMSKPLVQQLTLDELGGDVDLETVGVGSKSRSRRA